MLNLVNLSDPSVNKQNTALGEIERLDRELLKHFKSRFAVQSSLTRPLVSFQANKTRPVYRWYKYKEAFSASLVEHLFYKYGIAKGKILDPFAGSGTALFAASTAGINADGIELLPIGQQIVATKQLLDSEFTPEDFEGLKRWSELRVWEQSETRVSLPELRITKGAYPEKTKEAIEKYLGACQKENSGVQAVLRFALLCVLESVSYTRKDGQYLRWDDRSGRRQGKKPFDKGEILDLEQAICDKINEIVDMILSDIAEEVGFLVENILVLPNGKGNSSQQMGEHGREPLRKCVYVWRKR
jgi:hypothetical protein